ncbi:DMT family transporter [Phreatobacter sp.]|uniref:DMT family transporter n=1 Tax=Phreatobacter sp. TaxID=1966341 RepID=UPI003F726E2A
MSQSGTAIGIAAALASATAYGINIVYARMTTQMGVSAADLVFLRVFLMLGLVALAVGAMRSTIAVGPRGWPSILAIGITSAGVGLAYFFAVSFVPVGVAAVIFYTFPLIILAASPFIDGERFTLARLAIFALAFAGLVIALGPALGGLDWRGVALASLGSLIAAAQFFAAARAGARSNPAAVLFWSHVVIMPIAGAVMLAVGMSGWATLAAAWFPATITVAGYLAGFALQMLAARKAPPALIGLVFCLEPVVSIAMAGLVLGETLTTTQMIGSLFVLAALIATSAGELRRRPVPA